MPVFRVEKNKDYTVMANFHPRVKSLSLKAKGLLSQMLSLPEDWDYTLSGLCYINREKIDAIRETIRELECDGYIVRSRERDEKGRLTNHSTTKGVSSSRRPRRSNMNTIAAGSSFSRAEQMPRQMVCHSCF